MRDSDARNLIEDTFKGAYDEDKFREFIRNLLGNQDHFTESGGSHLSGQMVPESFRKKAASYKRIAKFVDKDLKEIDVLSVKLHNFKDLERSRSFQRNFVARYLNSKNKEAALVAFYTDRESEWRFSFVEVQYKLDAESKKMEKKNKKIKKEFTSARRSSFLVGEGIKKTHTAQKRLSELLLSNSVTLETIAKAFSVEPVTKEFFDEYYDLYDSLRKKLKNVSGLIDDEGNDILHSDFAKHLLGQLIFIYFLQKKRWLGAPKDSYFDKGDPDFLKNLFEKKKYSNFYQDKLTYLLHEALATERGDNNYYEKFNCKIPYLNGGLFESFKGHDWRAVKGLDNTIFAKIFEVFDRYNFTVREDEPLENEVAVDPEMLGKVFEDLIEENERKGSGTYYTPRKIVHYMCHEVLVDYLQAEFASIDRSDIEKFVLKAGSNDEHDAVVKSRLDEGKNSKEYKEFTLADSIIENASDIDKSLQNIRICDPAVGSGAFLVGMMLEIVRLRRALGATLRRSSTSYQLKKHCIENCLYGIDKNFSAVDIARLRFWLSLTIDEEPDSIKKDRIVPLPNLDYKIICEDALERVVGTGNLLTSDKVIKFIQCKNDYFSEENKGKKNIMKKEIEDIRKTIKGQNEVYDFKLDFPDIFYKNPNQLEKNGFDVIIGNPPYIQLQRDTGKLGKLYEKFKYESFAKTGDIYALFYERGVELLKPGGRLVFITSNNWMRTSYGKDLRKFFASNTTPRVLLDLGSDAFSTATVDTNILMIVKQKPKDTVKFRAATLHEHKKEKSLYKYMQSADKLPLPQSEGQWRILSEGEYNLLKKIEILGTPLKQLDVNMFRGIISGYDEAFVIDTETKEKLIKEDPRSVELIKPVLRGKDIKKWHAQWQDKWIIITLGLLDINIDDYPAIKNHFLSFGKEKLEQSGEQGARSKSGYKWFETQRPMQHYKYFEKPKIIYPNMTKFLPFVYDEERYFGNAKTFILNSQKLNLKNTTAFLNSNISKYWISVTCSELAGGTRELKKVLMEYLPVYKEINDHPELGEITDNITKGDDITENEAKLNKILYKLYDLNDTEIKLLEAKIAPHIE